MAETTPDMKPRQGPLAPEQAQDLVNHFGSRRAAARGVGADESTVRYWLNPEPKREQVLERHHGLSGHAFNRRLLQQRRWQALKRRDLRLEREAA